MVPSGGGDKLYVYQIESPLPSDPSAFTVLRCGHPYVVLSTGRAGCPAVGGCTLAHMAAGSLPECAGR